MGFLLNGQPLRVGRPFTDADGTQYPSNWLRLASEDEKAAIGITWEADPAPVDTRFYWSEGNPKRLEDEPVVDENGDPVLDADGVQMVNLGLKTTWVAEQKQIAGTLLAQTDWYVTRKAEDPTAEIPAAVATYRAAVRTTSGTREAEINACTTTEELAALLTSTEASITPWPEQG
jgi:hypothetical protein